MEPIAMVMRLRLERFGHVKRRYSTENTQAVVEIDMERTSRRGRPPDVAVERHCQLEGS